jgi:hypothetical protein
MNYPFSGDISTLEYDTTTSSQNVGYQLLCDAASDARRMDSLIISWFAIGNYLCISLITSRSRWPRSLRCRSAVVCLLGSRVQIPLMAWTFFFFVFCVASGLCNGLNTLSGEWYRVTICLTVCDLGTSKNEAA